MDKINLNSINEFPFSYEENLGAISELNDIKCSEIIFQGKINTINTGKGNLGEYIATGNIKAKVYANCVKCLEEVFYNLDLNFTALFTSRDLDVDLSKDNDNNVEQDIYPIIDEKIDFMPIIIDNIYSSLPMNVTCGDNCKGLCLVCGTNLNSNTCNCGDKIAEIKKSDKTNGFEMLKSMISFEDTDDND